MRKIICLLLIIVILCSCTSCSAKQAVVSWPLKEVSVVHDQYGNLLQQIIYNEQTEEYIIKEYTWTFRDNKWICTNQSTIIRSSCMESATASTEPSLNVYYLTNLVNGPIVIMDNKDVKVSLIEYLDQASWWEFGYKFKVENKSNKTLTIVFDDTSIAEVNCKPLFSIDHIESGHTAYFNFAWDRESLERSWIPYIDNVEFTLKVYNSNNWNIPALYGTKAFIKH